MVPKRFDVGHANCHFPAAPEDRYWRYDFQTIDLIIARINKRFNQRDSQAYKNFQHLVLKAARGEDYKTKFDFVTQFYGFGSTLTT